MTSTTFRESDLDELLQRFQSSSSLETTKTTTANYVSTMCRKKMSLDDIKQKLKWYNEMTDLNVTMSPVRGKVSQECFACGYSKWMKPEHYFSCFDKDGKYHKWCADCMAKEVGGRFVPCAQLAKARMEKEEETDSTTSSATPPSNDNCTACQVVLEQVQKSFSDDETTGFRCCKENCCSGGGVVYCLECAHHGAGTGGGQFCNGCSAFVCNGCIGASTNDEIYCSRACGGRVDRTSTRTTATSNRRKELPRRSYEYDSSDDDGSDIYFD